MEIKINWSIGGFDQLSWLWSDFCFSHQLSHFSYLQYSSMNFVLTNGRVVIDISQEEWYALYEFWLKKVSTQYFWENDQSQTHQNKEMIEQKWFNFLHSWLYCPYFIIIWYSRKIKISIFWYVHESWILSMSTFYYFYFQLCGFEIRSYKNWGFIKTLLITKNPSKVNGFYNGQFDSVKRKRIIYKPHKNNKKINFFEVVLETLHESSHLHCKNSKNFETSNKEYIMLKTN